MPRVVYLIIAISVIVLLIAAFFITYVLNKRTPVPKGCETLMENEHCASCNNTTCKFYKGE